MIAIFNLILAVAAICVILGLLLMLKDYVICCAPKWVKVLAAALTVLAFGCMVWASVDRLSWVRIVTHLIPPGPFRAWLLGW